MNEDTTIQTETTSATESGVTTITTPSGDATRTVEVDPATGEFVDRITQEEYDSLINNLNQIVENTTSTPVDPTANPSGMSLTFEQGQAILEKLEFFQGATLTIVVVIVVLFIIRWLYRFFGNFIFGGL